MAEFGEISGAAVDMGFDQRVNDLRYHQEQLKRQQDSNASKAKLFSDDLQFQNAANSYDMPRVQAMNKQIVQEIGDYVTQNPDWQTNVTKMGYVKILKNKLKDNPEVLRAFHSDSNHKQLLTDLQEVAKNPNQHDSEAYQNYLSKWDNYNRFGNQDGEDAARQEGAKPFTYVKPQDFVDLPVVLQKAGNSIKDYDVIKPKGGNIGEWYTQPKPQEVNALKQAIYQQHGRQIMVDAKKLGLTTPEQIDQWVTQGISSGFDKSHSIGDPNAQFDRYIKSQELALHKAKAAQAMQTGQYTPFDYLIDQQTKAGQMPTKDIEKVMGNKTHGPIIGNNGATADLSDFSIDYDGRFIKNNGLTYFLGKINVPLEVAQKRGIYENPWIGSGKITPDFIDKAKIVNGVDKDGKDIEYVQVDYQTPVDPRSKITRDMFNANVLPDKLVEVQGSPYGGGQEQLFVDEAGNVFDAKGNFKGKK